MDSSAKFQVDAATLSDKQACLRKLNLNSEWRLTRYRPKDLMTSLLRRGILQLSHAKPIAHVVAEAKASYLEKAANPGLDMLGGRDPYKCAMGYISLLETVLHGVAKTTLPVLHDPVPVNLNSSIEYRFLSWADDSGQLHRWSVVEDFSQDTLMREGHHWRTAGDICVSRTPMMLHLIAIGRQHEPGQFSSAWSRMYRHPAARLHIYKFHKAGPEWKAVYRQATDYSAAEWVEMGWKEGAIQPLMQDLLLEEPPENVRLDTLSQITQEAFGAKQAIAEDWRSLPMSRGSCDLYSIPCIWQSACYSKQTVEIDSIGLYTRRTVPVPGRANAHTASMG